MTTLTAADALGTTTAPRPEHATRSPFRAVSAPFEAPSTMAASLETTVQRTRRLAVAADRRRHRVTVVSSGIAVGLGSVGTLAFAILLVAGH
ncbi:hypothetical protein [Frondihabitans australicus]|uniref:Uncharacterized protein n=1 Tax=Frondihabitans australicus TaxID=386892 RepID=A0A495IEI0_9MICO|nr:hypothetical protein [Frondihabitans australicus]RKR74414.1 hypothetical protein C8E83_1526 [Frondihabitans australicus]